MESPEAPHLIVIMADQLRHDLLGPHTPHINALLEESCCCEQAYCCTPLCSPARAAFFTGRDPNRNGCMINPWDPRDGHLGRVNTGTPDLYQLLEKGWDSWHAGKQHLYTVDEFDKLEDSRTHWLDIKGYGQRMKAAGKRKPGGPAFQGMVPEMISGTTTRMRRYSTPTTGRFEGGLEDYYDGYILEKCLEAIDQRDPEKPFSLQAMFLAPHPPLEIPDPWFSRVKEIELPENVGLWSKGQSPLQLYNLTGVLGSRYSREDWQEIWRVYAGLVSLLDDCVGQIIDRLKSEGLYDNSLIVFTSDHGEMLGSHCLWQKMCLNEEATRVPLAFKLPKGHVSQPKVSGLVSHLDVLPTLCDFLDLETPDTLSGWSLRQAIESSGVSPRTAAHMQFDGNGALGNFSRARVEGSDKVIVDLFKDEIYFELYDLAQDPQELNNLAFTEPDRLRTLVAGLREYMRDSGDHLEIPDTAIDHFLTAYGPYCA